MEEEFDVTVVIATYNRSNLLAAALKSFVAQELSGLRCELIVVDNNSTDNTREVVNSFASCNPLVRYVLETRQGVSYARNAGITHSRAPVVAFTDDDCTVASDWISTVKKTFAAHPEVGFIGGKVLPVWSKAPPNWLTGEHWAPLGLQEHGDTECYLKPSGVRGLISANLAVRREAIQRAGMFSPAVQRHKGRIGTMEDHEFILRLWDAGVIGLYVPQLVVKAPVDPERIKKKYHRRWHTGHGHHYAIMREERMEKASWHLFGVPAHLYRQALTDTFGLIKHSVRRREKDAFLCEVHLRFFFGFWLKRVRDRLKAMFCD